MTEFKAEGQITLHALLSQGSEVFLEEYRRRCSDELEGTFYFLLGSLLFSAFEVEGCINIVGFNILGKAWPEELNWRKKICLIYGIKGSKPDFGKRPLQTIISLFDLRNGWAHIKPEMLNKSKERSAGDHLASKAFTSDFEDNVTIRFAEKCAQDVNNFFKELLEVSGVGWSDTITSGAIKTLFSTDLRANLASVMDRVNDDHEPVIVTRAKGKPVVMVSLEDWSSMDETTYLTASPANKRALDQAIAEYNSGAPLIVKTMEELKAMERE